MAPLSLARPWGSRGPMVGMMEGSGGGGNPGVCMVVSEEGLPSPQPAPSGRGSNVSAAAGHGRDDRDLVAGLQASLEALEEPHVLAVTASVVEHTSLRTN